MHLETGKISFFPPVWLLTPLFFDNMLYVIILNSTSDVEVFYDILIDTEKQTVNCSCKAGRIIGRCKHIKFYKALIKDLMHKNHRLWRDKGRS